MLTDQPLGLGRAREVDREEVRLHEQRLDQYLEMLLASVNVDGVWYGDYDIKSCKPRGEHSSYSDGEALLALTKAAKYLGRRQYVGPVMLTAAAGKRIKTPIRSVCVHSDSPEAVETAKHVRATLEKAGLTIAPVFPV